MVNVVEFWNRGTWRAGGLGDTARLRELHQLPRWGEDEAAIVAAVQHEVS